MSVYFLTSDAGSGGDTITHGDDDDASLALGRSIVDQVSNGHHLIQPGRVPEPRADITMGLPEPGIWVMLFIGFVGLCAAVFRRGKTDRLASAFGEDHPSLDLSRVASATSVEGSSRET
jgi:hypothetical protein